MGATKIKEFEKAYIDSLQFRELVVAQVENALKSGWEGAIAKTLAGCATWPDDSSVKAHELFIAKRIALALPEDERTKAEGMLREVGVTLFDG